MAILWLKPTLSALDDEQLILRIREGEDAAMEVLIGRYRRLARCKARAYFVVGADSDDVEQEALIGLFKAARDYRFDRDTSFRTFAEVCVSRHVLSAIKAATRHKHQPLNRAVSALPMGQHDLGAEVHAAALRDGAAVADPADEVVGADERASLRRSVIEGLSALEVDVLERFVGGESYEEIAAHLGRHFKAVDNAMQRIRRKLGPQLRGAGVVAAPSQSPLAA